MANRRVPLANVPNATNSPFRSTATATQKRALAHADEDAPHAKRRAVELQQENIKPEGDGKVFSKRPGSAAPQTTLQRRLAAAATGTQAPKVEEIPNLRTNRKGTVEDVIQWQRHYKKAFPGFVFYFESSSGISNDVLDRTKRWVRQLGGKEVIFFSKEVTHVITTRHVPSESDTAQPQEPATQPTNVNGSQLKTINPSLLDRHNDTYNQPQTSRSGRAVLDGIQAKRAAGPSTDVLVKAREMNKKIWAFEKLYRILDSLLNTNPGDFMHVSNQPTRATSALAPSKVSRDADLGALLRNERAHGMTGDVLHPKDMIQFRGIYIYVHDMDEKTRPVILREYQKVANKEDGKWPQFKATGPGKCPWLDDPGYAKRLAAEQRKEKEERAARQKEAEVRARLEAAKERSVAVPRTRSVTAYETRAQSVEDQPLQQVINGADRVRTASEKVKPLDPPSMLPSRRTDSMPPLTASTAASIRHMQRFQVGKEPTASGVNPSNITSAIKSQMISSTSAIGKSCAGNSKEISQLKRKVFEKNAPSANSIPSSYMNDVRAAINGGGNMPQHGTKRKAEQESLEDIAEEEAAQPKPKVAKKKAAVERDPKPGYCENCKEKYDDFDSHIISKKHRRFALTGENWKELDQLLAQLDRPLRM